MSAKSWAVGKLPPGDPEPDGKADTIMQQVAKGGMTQKQMQDAQATIAAISAQIELRKQAAEALKDDYERKREIAEKKAQRLLRQEDSPAVMEAKIKDGLTFWNS